MNQMSPVQIQQARSVFFGVIGAPYTRDWTMPFFRLLTEVLDRGTDTVVWTCGNATTMTSKLMWREGDPIHPHSHSHSCSCPLPDVASELLRSYPDNLRWYICKYCMEERGAINQIDGVEIKLPFSFDTYTHMADQSLVFGTK
ncbi:MAG: hypothetical protein AAFQ51_08930 [Pseudomonadota bacterium]